MSFCLKRINVGCSLLQGGFPGKRVPQALKEGGGGHDGPASGKNFVTKKFKK